MSGGFLCTNLSYIYMNVVLNFLGIWSIAQHENADLVLMVRRKLRTRPGCSKLMTLLVNEMLHFQTYCMQKHCHVLHKKNADFVVQSSSFLWQKLVAGLILYVRVLEDLKRPCLP